MKTKTQKIKSAPEIQSRSKQLSTPVAAQKPVSETQTQTTEPRGVLHIDFAQRKLHRELPTEQVLDLLERRLRPAFELAEQEMQTLQKEYLGAGVLRKKRGQSRREPAQER